MPRLYGKDFTRSELTARAGRFAALAGITVAERIDGSGRGIREVVVRSGGGLTIVALADRALDVALAHFNEIPLCWSSCNEPTPPSTAPPHGDDFLDAFVGGLFTTCGLANFGPAGEDAWGAFGLHGRIDMLAASDIRSETIWASDRACVLEVSGTVRETRVFGDNFRLERRLRMHVGENRLEVHDRVTNDAGTRRPHMLLYHCNGGFPILDESAELYVSHRHMHPRDSQAAAGLSEWNRGGSPQPGFDEQVFVHEPIACRDGRAMAMLWNPNLAAGRGLGLAVHFDPVQLPAFFSWRMLGEGTYVMGMEPANCPTVEGRVEAGRRGTLPFLEPGESRDYDLEFAVIDGDAQFQALRADMPAVAG